MSIENEAIYQTAEAKAEKKVFDQMVDQMVDNEIEADESIHGFDFSFLLAKTGEGSIADYIDHPLNFNKKEGTAQILRGLTGMFCELDLAIIDIGLGIIRNIGVGKHGEANI